MILRKIEKLKNLTPKKKEKGKIAVLPISLYRNYFIVCFTKPKKKFRV